MRWKRVMALVALGATGCMGPRLVGDGPYATPDDVPEGSVRYYVGKDVLVVKATRTDRHRLEPDPKSETGFSQVTEVSSLGLVGLRTLPDTSRVYRLDFIPGTTSDDELKIQLAANGILSAVDVTSDSKAGEVLKNVAVFAGSALGFLAFGGGGLLVGPALDQVAFSNELYELSDKRRESATDEDVREVIRDRLQELSPEALQALSQADPEVKEAFADAAAAAADLGASVRRRSGRRPFEALREPDVEKFAEKQEEAARLEEEAALGLQEALEAWAARFAASKGGDLETQLKDLLQKEVPLPLPEERTAAEDLIHERVGRLATLYVAILSKPDAGQARRLWTHAVLLDVIIARRQSERMRLQRELATVADKDALRLLTDRLAALEVGIKALVEERTSTLAAFDAEVARHVAAAAETLPRNKELSIQRVLEMTGVPEPAHVFVTSQQESAHPYGAVEARLAGFPESLRLLREAGVLVTIEYPASGFPTGGETAFQAPACPGGPGAALPRGRIHYRQSFPARLEVWVHHQLTGVPGHADVDELLLVSQEHVDIVHPASRVEWVQFDPVAFAKASVKLTFDAKSRLLSVGQSTTSSAAGLTGALAESSRGFRDQFADSVAKVAAIQENRRKIKLDALTLEVDTLTKRKQALDARIGLQGATATEADVLEQKRLQAQLDLATTRVNLAKIDETGDLVPEVERLKLEVERLNQQILFLQKQATLLELQSR